MTSRTAALLAVALSLATTAGFADTIAVRFVGTGSGTLDEAEFNSTIFEITATYDTSGIRPSPVLLETWRVPLDNVDLTIDGIGTGPFQLPTALFANRPYSNAGLTRLESREPLFVGLDLLDVESPLFTTYDLTTPIGPIFDPTPLAVDQFNDVATSLGVLTFASIWNVTFQTTLVPEPSAVVMFVVALIAVLSVGRRAQCKRLGP